MDVKQLLQKQKVIREDNDIRIDAILSSEVRAAFDLKTQKGRRFDDSYGLGQTRKEAAEIKKMLDRLKLDKFRHSEEAQEKRLKLQAIQGRKLSHLLVNDNLKSSDSPEMAAVKLSVGNLERVLTKKHQKPLTKENIEYISSMYRDALIACKSYCNAKNPWTIAGKMRKANVQATLKRLMRESDMLELGKRVLLKNPEGAKTVTSGMELLSFGAITQIAERFKDKRRYQVKKDDAGAGRAQVRNEQEQALKDANPVETLPKELKGIAKFLNEGGTPSAQIKNIKKPTTAEKKLMSQLVEVKNALISLHEGEIGSKTITIGDYFVRFIQDGQGRLEMQAAGLSVPILHTAENLAAEISRDVILHQELYGDNAVLRVMYEQKTDLKEMTLSELLNTREYAAHILTKQVGVEKSLLNNIPVDALKEMALAALNKREDLTRLKERIVSEVKNLNEFQKEGTVNTILNLEMQKVGLKADGVILELKKKEEKSGWDEKEEKVRKLFADMIFTEDSLSADELQYKPGERMKKVLRDNLDALAWIVSDQFRKDKDKTKGLVESVFDSLPLFAMEEKKEGAREGEQGVGKLKEALAGMLETLRDKITEEVKKQVEKRAKEENKDEAAKKADEEKALKKLKGKSSVKLMLMGVLNRLSPEQMDDLADLEQSIDKTVSENMDAIQNRFNGYVDKLFSDQKKEKKEGEKAEEKQEQKAEEKKEEAPDPLAEYQAARNQMDQLEDKLKDLQADTARCEEQIKRLQELIQADKKLQNTLKKEEEKADVQERIRKNKKSITALQKDVRINKLFAEEQQQRIKNLMVSVQLKKQAAEAEEKARKQQRINAIHERMRLRKEEADKSLAGYLDQRKIYVEVRKKNVNTLTGREKTLYQSAPEALNLIDKEIKKLTEKNNKKGADELGKILKDASKGKKGQGLFVRNVLKTYFKSMPVQDQRSMLAGALRNCKKMPAAGQEQQRKNLTEDEELNLMSDMLGGMFKGAGPLFQKMLQGLPAKDFPEGMKKAIEDTQDNLASIPEPVIKNHMNAIIGRSNGKIEKIEVKSSLGAASVGQAFLCRMYGPKLGKDGQEVVIKLLRPDVRNRMMREKETMLNAARMTDRQGKQEYEIREMEQKKQIGGMEATYMGNLQRIEEELDLTIEVKNCEKGAVYDKDLETEEKVNGKTKKVKLEKLARSMKMSSLADPTSDSCIMEKAGTKTVKRYMSDVREQMTEKLRKFCETETVKDEDGNEQEVLSKEKDGSFKLRENLSLAEQNELQQIYEELDTLLTDVEKRQQGLLQLTQKWVTEGVYEKGYYHGDLHAGNIMISENDPGVTAIDFGNATELTAEQQKHVTIMMTAAAASEVELFRHSFHMLLQNTPEEVYQEKRDELTAMLEEVFSLGTKANAGERIAVALVKAQELGLELPPVIANFSSGQMRLQNTVNDMNSLFKDLRNNVAKLSRLRVEPSKYHASIDPVAQILDQTNLDSTKERRVRFALELKRFEVTQEKDFKEQLKDKDGRVEFAKLYNLPMLDDKLDVELARANEILRTGKLTEQEKEAGKGDEDDFRKLFPALHSYQDMLQKIVIEKTKGNAPDADEFGNKLNLVTMTLGSLRDMLNDPVKGISLTKKENGKEITRQIKASSLDELVEQIRQFDEKAYGQQKFPFIDESILQGSELQRKIKDFYRAQDTGASPEEMDRLADEVWAVYHTEKGKQEQENVETNHGIIKHRMSQRLPQASELGVLEKKKKYREYMMAFKDAAESCEDNQVNGKELKAEKEKFLALYEKSLKNRNECVANEKELKESFERFAELLAVARVAKLRELSKTVEARKPSAQAGKTYSTKDPEDFLSVMGDVISNYIMKTGERLGYFTALRIRKKIDAETD